MFEIAAACPMPCSERVVIEKHGEQKGNTILTLLLCKVIKASKRIFGAPAFHYYAIAAGITAILARTSKGPLCAPPPPIHPDTQQWLFDTF